MNSPALQAHLDPAGKDLDDLPAFLPCDRSYCYCDFCLQVRDSLGVVAIHSVLKVFPQIKILGGSSPVNEDDNERSMTINTERYAQVLGKFWTALSRRTGVVRVLQWFQHDAAIPHTSNESLA